MYSDTVNIVFKIKSMCFREYLLFVTKKSPNKKTELRYFLSFSRNNPEGGVVQDEWCSSSLLLHETVILHFAHVFYESGI